MAFNLSTFEQVTRAILICVSMYCMFVSYMRLLMKKDRNLGKTNRFFVVWSSVVFIALSSSLIRKFPVFSASFVGTTGFLGTKMLLFSINVLSYLLFWILRRDFYIITGIADESSQFLRNFECGLLLAFLATEVLRLVLACNRFLVGDIAFPFDVDAPQCPLRIIYDSVITVIAWNFFLKLFLVPVMLQPIIAYWYTLTDPENRYSSFRARVFLPVACNLLYSCTDFFFLYLNATSRVALTCDLWYRVSTLFFKIFAVVYLVVGLLYYNRLVRFSFRF